ncbi:MogA/MoaB family molybdenum cofactor biosynthesis protein [Bacillus sp. FJAT-47783]|uniref:MogA/MoaB family molybdenum cofactor biosynthesis protein n=1 Tax=Bacillus sp. FJAT-47783 TaxID=2922712 RepID=UPI001FACB0B4|nr:MogA/MoaB family molybdenum cofactor biosynthesis protein [Bacillus sp. FJAT-47783]
MSVNEHKHDVPKHIRVKVITISDTRTERTDRSGERMMEMLKAHGHIVQKYEIVKDEPTLIRNAVLRGCEDPEIDVVLTNGGTGISKRDQTIEAMQTIIEKEITGFGELFRYLSYIEDIGSAAMLSRAIGGIALDTAIFSVPGSTGAVKLAMEKLILPEIGHVVKEIRK